MSRPGFTISPKLTAKAQRDRKHALLALSHSHRMGGTQPWGGLEVSLSTQFYTRGVMVEREGKVMA